MINKQNINYSSERAGWIPKFGDMTANLASQYGWVYGLSVTEMEIVHGAFRKLNPNGMSSPYIFVLDGFLTDS